MFGHKTRYQLIHEYFSHSAQTWPDKVAVEEKEHSVIFSELFFRAQSLANLFIQRGFITGDRVIILISKSAQALIAAFATSLAGGIYIPIDPEWPAERIQSVIDNCDPRFIIGSSVQKLLKTTNHELWKTWNLFVADRIDDRRVSKKQTPMDIQSTFNHSDIVPQQPAYILFTSGSSGQPKGVTISHKAALTFAEWAVQEFGITEHDRIACPAPLSFDLSTFDMFTMALCGATLVVVPKELFWKPKFLSAFLEENQISIWYSVPYVLMLMMNEGELENHQYPALRHLLFAGEVFPMKHLKRLRSMLPDVNLWNLYGPTETNVVSRFLVPRNLSGYDSIPIGTPCPYAEFILDFESGTGINAPDKGELFITSKTMMTGYWGMERETENTFVTHQSDQSFQKLYYKTGDLVRLEKDGNYTFLGRNDRRIKHFGHRIELAEIENAILHCDNVLETAVINLVQDGSVQKIIAFIRMKDTMNISSLELKSVIMKRLPSYMVPDEFIFTDSIPKNKRGKIDYKRLEHPIIEDKIID